MSEFDQLTLKELLLILEVYKDKWEQKQKRDNVLSYNIASMTAQFVALSLNGKRIPAIGSIFPEFKDTCGLNEEEYNKRLQCFREEQLIAKINKINNQRKGVNNDS